MGFPSHLDVNPEHFGSPGDVIGEVTAVFLPDHERNPTSITLYQVVALKQKGIPKALISDFVPYLGMQSGGSIEKEIPLEVGDYVVVGFLEKDVNRPFVWGKYIPKKQNTNIQQTEDTYPQPTWLTNGVKVYVTKTGKVVIEQREDQTIEIRDSSGKKRVEFVEGGESKLYDASEVERVVVRANGDVELGDTSALNRLIDERAAAIFNDHGHIETGAPGGVTSKPVVGVLAPPLPLQIGSGQMTTKTKAG